MDSGVASADGGVGAAAGVDGQEWAPLEAQNIPGDDATAGKTPLSADAGSVHDSVHSAPQRGLNGKLAREDSVSIEAAPGSAAQQMVVADEGGGWLSISTPEPPAAAAQQQWVVFEVQDTGVGIPSNSLRSLFQYYSQVQPHRPRTRSGTGLGLAICSRQAEVLGGGVGALSRAGGGSVFWFKVPLEVAAGAHAEGGVAATPAAAAAGAGGRERMDASLEQRWQAAAQPPAAAAAAPAAAPALPLAGMRILLAEDNLINRKVACRLLATLGAECATACNGREAVEAVAATAAGGAAYDAVLMDVCMPVLGGIEATQEIRAAGCQIPIVAMTANTSDRDRDECLAAGMDLFLSKPVLREALSACLKEACKSAGAGAPPK